MSKANPTLFRDAMELHRKGDFNAAEPLYRAFLKHDPNNANAWSLLGLCRASMERYVEAIDAFERAQRLMPRSADLKIALAHAEYRAGRLDAAERTAREAVDIQPNDTQAHNMLAIALRYQGRSDEAEREFHRALELDPNNAEAMTNLGDLMRIQRRLDEAVRMQERAIAINPNLAAAHWNLAEIYLLTGNYARGFDKFEWRWSQSYLKKYRPEFSQPAWDGSPLNRRTILIYAEQGLGDLIQFARFFELVAQRGGRVIVECPRNLAEIIRTARGVSEIVTRSDQRPPFDCHAAIMSLPRLLGITLETIPATIPYLHVAQAKIEAWRARLPREGKTVGIAWAGNRDHDRDRERSIDVSLLAPLIENHPAGVNFVSLQLPRDPAAAQLGLIDLTDDLVDFTETAALMMNLDLIVGVDTSVVHLAGALGRPVWTMLANWPDWRWLLDRDDTPWYPTMRLFRQPTAGNWNSVIERVGEALSTLSE